MPSRWWIGHQIIRSPAAWRADANLFARGVAEIVTDEALTREPLEHPGTIIKCLRGSQDEHLAALLADVPKPKQSKGASGSSSRKASRAAARKVSSAKPKPKPKPRPSREALEAAERDLEALEKQQKDEDQALRDREEELQRERRDLERTQDRGLSWGQE